MATVWATPADDRTGNAGTAAGTGAAPVTPAEVAALARRIRVEAKLGRITAVGTVLGLACGAAAVWPFLDGGYMAEALVRSDLGPVGFVPGWLLAGLLPLLAFYAGRLQFESGRSSTGEIETSLRKIRRVILGCMFASATAFVVVLGERLGGGVTAVGPSWLTLTYAGCFAACAFIVSDVRRGLGDFDSEHQRRRRKLARGFTVELRPPGGPTAAPDGASAHAPADAMEGADAIPLAKRADDGAAPPHFPALSTPDISPAGAPRLTAVAPPLPPP